MPISPFRPPAITPHSMPMLYATPLPALFRRQLRHLRRQRHIYRPAAAARRRRRLSPQLFMPPFRCITPLAIFA